MRNALIFLAFVAPLSASAYLLVDWISVGKVDEDTAILFRSLAMIITAAITVATLIVTQYEKADKFKGIKHQEILNFILKAHIPNAASFINRRDKLREIFDSLQANRIINIHGKKGSGKSELLKLFVDLVNGHHSTLFANELDPFLKQKKIEAAVHLETSQCSDGLIPQLGAIFGVDDCKTVEELVYRCNKIWDDKPILFVFDNITQEVSYKKIAQHILELRRLRAQDSFLIGSVLRFDENVAGIKYLSIGGLENRYAREYCKKICKIDDYSLIGKIVDASNGLPIFIQMYSMAYSRFSSQGFDLGAYDTERLIVDAIFPALKASSKEVLHTLAAMCVYDPMVSIDHQYFKKFQSFETSLFELNEFGLIIRSNQNIMHIKVHDLIRDTLNNAFPGEFKSCAKNVSDYYHIKGDLERFTAFAFIGNDKNWEDVNAVLKVKADQSDNLFVSRCYEFALYRDGGIIPSHVVECLKICYIRALLSQGEYKEAQQESRHLRIPLCGENELSVLYHYALADIDHLQNRYELAKENALLIASRLTEGTREHLAKCLWLAGHNQSHMGINLDEAYALLDEAQDIANQHMDTKIELLSANGKVAIGLMKNSSLVELEDIIQAAIKKTDGRYELLPEKAALIRSMSRVKLKMGLPDKGKTFAEEALAITTQIMNRSIHDSLHCLADNLRALKEYKAAECIYIDLINMADESGDINLKCTATLGYSLNYILNQDASDAKNKAKHYEEYLLETERVATDHNIKVNELRARLIRSILPSTKPEHKKILLEGLDPQLEALGLEYEREMISNNFPTSFLMRMDVQAQ